MMPKLCPSDRPGRNDAALAGTARGGDRPIERRRIEEREQ
jgi:hypothetical protein